MTSNVGVRVWCVLYDRHELSLIHTDSSQTEYTTKCKGQFIHKEKYHSIHKENSISSGKEYNMVYGRGNMSFGEANSLRNRDERNSKNDKR